MLETEGRNSNFDSEESVSSTITLLSVICVITALFIPILSLVSFIPLLLNTIQRKKKFEIVLTIIVGLFIVVILINYFMSFVNKK